MASSGYCLCSVVRRTNKKTFSWRNVYIMLTVSLLASMFACEKNHPPIISEIIQNPESTSAGTIYTLRAEATDEDGDPLEYLWAADKGDFLTPVDTKEVDWRSPADGKGDTFSIRVGVTDGEFIVNKELKISLSEPILGGVLGTVYFSNTKVPIEGVIIKVADKETHSGSRGEYTLSGLVSRKDTMVANKEDYSPKESVISIPPDQVLHYDIEMLSITHSSKISGRIVDQDGDPVQNAEIVVVNPNRTESRLKDITDDNGQYRILYVPHGERQVLVRKAMSDDYKYVGLDEKIEFSEIEQRVDFVMEKISLRGSIIDIRDGQEYPYKTIGNQTWIVTNLAYLPKVHEPTDLSDTDPRFYVYGYEGSDTAEAKDLEKYRNYGVLYNWQAAQKICPFGWHLPGTGEWQDMTYHLYPDAGSKLRSVSGWADDGNGTNSSGFSAIPGGMLSRKGEFTYMNTAAYFQTSSGLSSKNSYYIQLSAWSNYIRPMTEYKRAAYSVRCVRDN